MTGAIILGMVAAVLVIAIAVIVYKATRQILDLMN
jgi:hypothetical protein